MERWAQAQHPDQLYRSAFQLCVDAERGDRLAQAAVERVAGYLGLGVANLITLYAPEVVVLGGGLMESQHLFLPAIREIVRTHCGYVPHERVQIVPVSLGIHSGLVGAAQVWVSRYTI
jgi:glucokinase